MRPRIGDPRIPFIRVGDVAFSVESTADGQNAGQSASNQYIVRFRLEKRDTAAAVSDVVRPIVYYINANIPESWRPWIERGIKAWSPVLESIGFRNAIVIRSEPENGPAVSQDTAVHIRINPQESDAATYPTIDPNTGEVLKAVMDLSPTTALRICTVGAVYGNWPSTIQPEHACPDSIVGRVLQMIVTHEVGHSLGLNHNFKAGVNYPTDSLRSASFVHRWGHTPSVMGYTYFNYVAQPEDHIPLDDMFERIGPYDVWALGIAYRPIPGAVTPQDELPTLEQWRAVQDTTPYLRATIARFGNSDPGEYPGVLSDDILKAADYGLRNLERHATHLTELPDSLAQWRFAGMWMVLLSYRLAVLGGVLPQTPYPRDLDKIVTAPVDSARQLQAVDFILAHLLHARDDVVRAAVQGRTAEDTSSLVLFDSLTPGWSARYWPMFQLRLWTGLVSEDRLEVLARRSQILPAVCARLREADQTIAKALATELTPKGRAQAEALRDALAPALGAEGHCHTGPAKTQ